MAYGPDVTPYGVDPSGRGYEFPSYDAKKPPYDVNHPYPGWIPPMRPTLIPVPPGALEQREQQDYGLPPLGPKSQLNGQPSVSLADLINRLYGQG